MVHDAAYARRQNLKKADLDFAYANFGKGFKRTLAAAAVGFQGLLRAPDSFIELQQTMTKPNLRGSVRPNGVSSKLNGVANITRPTSKSQPDQQVSVPASIGSIIKGSRSKTLNKSGDSIRMHTRVCVGRSNFATQAGIPEMTGIQILNPVSMGNDEVQNMVRVYQHYRIHSARVHYAPFQGTSVGGEVIIVSNDDPNYKPADTSSSTTFFQRALSTEHSLLTPIWCPAELELAVDNGWKVCDNLNSTSLEEFSSGIFFTYVDGTVAIPGYLLVDMDIEFQGLRFNPRLLISGSYSGLASRRNLQFINPVLNSDAVATVTGMTIGDIYYVQLSTTSAVFAAGVTSTNLFTISSGAGVIPFTIDGSTAVYGRASSTTTMTLFTTYDSAVGYDNSDKLLYGVTVALTTQLTACLLTQLRNSTQPTL
jgi:hypothetical protein